MGSVFKASLSMIGVCGLFFFIVGYALVRNDLIGRVFSLCIDENEAR